MQYGILKYDEWEELIWIYNSIDTSIRTSLTGSLIGVRCEDESIKYTHFLGGNQNPYNIAGSYNAYCGCHDNSIYSMGVYPENLLLTQGNDLFVASKDGNRLLGVLSQPAQYELTAGGTRHICCGIPPSTPSNSKIVLSNNSNELYFVDVYTGQVQSRLSAAIESSGIVYTGDKISCISDFMLNQCASSCSQSYQLETHNTQGDQATSAFTHSDFNYSQQLSATSEEASGQTTEPNSEWKTKGTSFQSIAEKYGSVESIPEFVPGNYSASNTVGRLGNYGATENVPSHWAGSISTFETHQNSQASDMLRHQQSHTSDMSMANSNYMERTIGSLSLECCLKDLTSSRTLRGEFVETTCVGMASGLLHVVDNRTSKIVSSIKCSNSPVYSISASNNTIATTSCTLFQTNSYGYHYSAYPYSNAYSLIRLFEPVIYFHDIRMMKSKSLILPNPVSKLCIVPKTDRLFALGHEGNILDCTISTLEYKEWPAKENPGSSYQDLEVCAHAEGDVVDVFVSDSTYSLSRLKLENKLSRYLDYSSSKLPDNLKVIPKSESRNYNNTPFGSLVGTYDGDLAHLFVQMFFFLPKMPSIKYHVCESDYCITCQVGFGIHRLQVHYENSLDVNSENRGKTTKETHKGKYSNNIMFVTQLQRLMREEGEQSLRTPLNLLLWLIEKMNTEMHNYYSKNNLNVTTELMRDLFSYSKKTTSRCAEYNHVNTKTTTNNFYVSYEKIRPQSSSGSGNSNNADSTRKSDLHNEVVDSSNGTDEDGSNNSMVMEYCSYCNKIVESAIAVEFINTPNVLILDFSSSTVDRIEQELVVNGYKYNLSSFFFTFPLENMYYRPLAYVKLPQEYKTNDHEWILINDGIVMYDTENEDIFDFTKNWKILLFGIYVVESDKDIESSRSDSTLEPSKYTKETNSARIKPGDFDSIEEIVPCIDEKENITSVKGRLVPLPYPTRKAPVPSYIFMSEHNIAHNPLAHNKIQTFTPISIDELKLIENSSFVMALDIEYVKSDMKNISPFHNSSPSTVAENKSSFIVSEEDDKYIYTLARVSAVRGNDINYGVPFLDHYILNSTPPKDYMTRFSGIHSGDLALKSSMHWLTTEKMIYLKLRYLIDNGCKVIGHGLEQDFRILNICVPKENIIDTVELFWIPGKRYLSLQFLAYYVLNRKIQEYEHDSVEDAKTALQLYKMYINYKLNKKLDVVINKLYEIGYQTNWTLK
ncbi:poly(A)-specific ribonuclease [Theileria orientalis]|uniref:Poly(A)-specific ribonuclease n=1 Tax=Theileria orientalis TaxID=68886 RepID=A0A976MCW3_THEOR|nr:poly(A)-specific ribonuclease [Theileria orientalis]